MQTLRVGYVSIWDSSLPSSWSGIPFSILRHLRLAGAEVLPIYPLHQHHRYLFAAQMIAARRRGKTAGIDRHPVGLWSYARQIQAKLDSNPVDVVFAPTSVPITRLKCRQPIVFWTDATWHAVHGYYPFAVTQGAKAHALAQEEAALQNCTFAVYASEWAANSARQFVSHDKVKVLPFGANMFIEHGPDDIQEWVQSRSRQLSNRVSLLFVGIDWERKGLRTAIETVRILNDRGIAATLKVVGARPNFDLPNFVEHLGFIDKGRIEGRNLLTQLYRDSHFFILPTTAESAGVVFCEASAHALPILAYATGGVPDYVKRDVNGFALECHLGAPDFADAAEGLIKAPEQYTALAVSAYNEYVTRLNWDSSIGRLLNLFGEAIELHNPKKSAT